MKYILAIMTSLIIFSSSTVSAISVGELLAGVNQVRASHGAAPLSMNSQLSNSAQSKAADMCSKNYWSHGNWIAFINASGYQYKKAGENLAYGFQTSADTVRGWVNSPTHFANMIDPVFTEAGFGIVSCPGFQGSSSAVIVANHFGQPIYTYVPPKQPIQQPVKPKATYQVPQPKVEQKIIEAPKPESKPKVNKLYELLISLLPHKHNIIKL